MVNNEFGDLSERMDFIYESAGTLENCPEAYLAEIRFDINKMSQQIAGVEQRIRKEMTNLQIIVAIIGLALILF